MKFPREKARHVVHARVDVHVYGLPPAGTLLLGDLQRRCLENNSLPYLK